MRPTTVRPFMKVFELWEFGALFCVVTVVEIKLIQSSKLKAQRFRKLEFADRNDL